MNAYHEEFQNIAKERLKPHTHAGAELLYLFSGSLDHTYCKLGDHTRRVGLPNSGHAGIDCLLLEVGDWAINQIPPESLHLCGCFLYLLSIFVALSGEKSPIVLK